MKQKEIINSTFTRITSKNNAFEIKVGRPDNNKVNLFLNFNVFAYTSFISTLEKVQYLKLKNVSSYEDGTSGLSIELIQDSSLHSLISDLPEFLFEYIEKVQPKQTIHTGNKAN